MVWPTFGSRTAKERKRIEQNVGPPRSTIVGISSVLRFGLYSIYSFGDIAIFIFCRFGLKLPVYVHFGGFGGIFLPNMFTHRSNNQKNHPCVEARRLSHKA